MVKISYQYKALDSLASRIWVIGQYSVQCHFDLDPSGPADGPQFFTAVIWHRCCKFFLRYPPSKPGITMSSGPMLLHVMSCYHQTAWIAR